MQYRGLLEKNWYLTLAFYIIVSLVWLAIAAFRHEPITGLTFKFLFFVGIFLKGWTAVRFEPLLSPGLNKNKSSARLLNLVAELLIWGSCGWLALNNYTPWIWIVGGIVGRFWIPSIFKREALAKLSSASDPITSLGTFIAKTPVKLKDGTEFENTRAALIAAGEKQNTDPIRYQEIRAAVMDLIEPICGADMANQILDRPVTPDSHEDIERRQLQRQALDALPD